MNSTDAFLVNWPGRIVFGAGKLAVLGDEVRSLGCRRVLVVTTRDLVRLGVVERAERILAEAGLTATRFDGVEPDPSCDDVDRAAVDVRQAGVDAIVALGGGSAIDFAKASAAAATHD
ncbi:MAG: iron-containing alcohol dehydrogenase, partial [Planctomycetia bacterium]